MKYTITNCGQNFGDLTFFEFCDWYYDNFGTDCGNPAAIRDGLLENQTTYLGKGFSVTAISDAAANPQYKIPEPGVFYCCHNNKYTQKHRTFEFDYCPDCKKEV